jgi:hypothetical protein
LHRVRLDPATEALTFDRRRRLGDLNAAVRGQYDVRRPPSGSDAITGALAGGLRNLLGWGTSDRARAAGTAGLLSSLAGAGGGYMWSRYTGDSMPRSMLLAALLAGGLGTAGAALAQRQSARTPHGIFKSAASDVTAALILAVRNDRSIGPDEKAQILRALARADAKDRDDMYRLVRTSIGAAAGVVIARFLRGKGLLPALVGGMVGGALARPGRPRPIYNGQGQLSILNYM